MNKFVIGIGSNISPWENVKRAKTFLKREFDILASSSFIETHPVGVKNQPDFVNGAVLIETSQPIENLKRRLKEFENQIEIKPAKGRGACLMDLDILASNGEILELEVYERKFLQTFLKELCPGIFKF
jgi:2-amino-4-hydroxy-6-hydroxymethyldihydropteridine diphosphokinase